MQTRTVRTPGSFAISGVLYADSVPAGAYDFYYTSPGDSGLDLVVDQHDESGDYLWASWEGSLTLTDTVSGGTSTMTRVTVESWPRFGSK